jgi:hypothetical protein
MRQVNELDFYSTHLAPRDAREEVVRDGYLNTTVSVHIQVKKLPRRMTSLLASRRSEMCTLQLVSYPSTSLITLPETSVRRMSLPLWR